MKIEDPSPGHPRQVSRKVDKVPSYERRILWMAILAGVPGALVSLVVLWSGDFTPRAQWTLSVVILGVWLGMTFALKDRVVVPLQTLSNLLAALREGDYSIRARAARGQDALADVMAEANALAETLRGQRLDALDATTLLRKVMAEIDVAIFTFDDGHQLRLVNKAGERLLNQPAERLLGSHSDALGLSECLEGEAIRTTPMIFPGHAGRFGIRRTAFREKGLPHQLLVLSDLSQTLREEERQAWQRLIRVLGHELNNTLAPIKSIVGSLSGLITREQRPDDWLDDMKRGLGVIGGRAEALGRFMGAYARLARLPQPTFQSVAVAALVHRVAGLETRLAVDVVDGPAITVQADPDQLEQLLINLLKNAVEAALETKGSVHVGWRKVASWLEVWIDDAGPGLSNLTNIFVPFFTTKPEGTGIGLVLCRQIAEAHGGTLTLENRRNATGCEARLRLPL